jgi:CBS domain-containing protein
MSLNQTALQAKRYGVFTCDNCSTLSDAVRRMVDEDVSALVITDEAGGLSGILSRTDVMRAALDNPQWPSRPIREYMSDAVVTVPTDATLRDVAEILLDHRIHRVVVVQTENGYTRPLSVISAADIVYHLSKDI